MVWRVAFGRISFSLGNNIKLDGLLFGDESFLGFGLGCLAYLGTCL